MIWAQYQKKYYQGGDAELQLIISITFTWLIYCHFNTIYFEYCDVLVEYYVRGSSFILRFSHLEVVLSFAIIFCSFSFWEHMILVLEVEGQASGLYLLCIDEYGYLNIVVDIDQGLFDLYGQLLSV